MRTNKTTLLLLATVFTLSCKSTLTPEITSFTPDKGIPGTVVEVTGKNFNPVYYQNEINIGGGKTKILSGSSTSLRMVLLRDIQSGPLVYKDLVSNEIDSSSTDFKREGSTLQATPEEDSGPELVKGRLDLTNRGEYDMQAQGLNQEILIVLAQPDDIINPDSTIYFDSSIAPTARDYIVERASKANTYFQQASNGKTSVNFTVAPDWVPLSQVRDFYMWQQDDIDRAQNALDGAQAALDALLLDPSATEAQVTAAEEEIEEKKTQLKTANDKKGMVQQPDFYYAEAMLGAKSMLGDIDTFTDYVVICAGGFLRGSCCWKEESFNAEATLLGLDLNIDFNAQKGLTYMAQGTHWGRLGHELSHFFAGGDLYSSNGTVGTASNYAFMGSHDRGPLYVGYNMEKRLEYFNPANLKKLTWGSSPTFNETFDVVAHANTIDNTADDVVNLISLKVTEGMYYHIEVRQRPDAGSGTSSDYIFDAQLPLTAGSSTWEGGVIVTRSIEENNQNNNQERNIQLMPPERLLQVGDNVNDPARTLKISVEQKLVDRPLKYRVRVEWGTLPAADPDGQFDLRIRPWSPPPWESPDIWANSLKNDETMPTKIIYKNHEAGDETKPIGNGDSPWVKNDNFIYTRIRNNGSVPTPEPVKVSVYVNTPPGVGDDGNWGPFAEVNLGILEANADTIVRIPKAWRPSVGEHTCVKVYIQPMTGEITFDNNMAQENFVEFEAESGSPFKPVEFDVDVRNPYDRPVIMDMKARDVPRSWNAALEYGSVYLEPEEVKRMHVILWTDADHSIITGTNTDNEPRKFNRKPLIGIEGWVDGIGHSHFPVGGMTAFPQAVISSAITVKPFYEQPDIQGRGRVSPPNKGGIPVAVHAVETDGTRHSTTTVTQNDGTFTFTISAQKGFKSGKCEVTAYTLPGSTLATAESPTVTIQVN